MSMRQDVNLRPPEASPPEAVSHGRPGIAGLLAWAGKATTARMQVYPIAPGLFGSVEMAYRWAAALAGQMDAPREPSKERSRESVARSIGIPSTVVRSMITRSSNSVIHISAAYPGS